MSEKLNSAPIFSIEKKHAWRGRLIRLLGIVLVLVVLLGTVGWVVVASDFSFDRVTNQILRALSPKVASDSNKTKGLSSEEQLKILINEEKLFEIESLKKTPQGDLELQAKDGPIIFIAIKKDLSDQVKTLQTLLAKAKIENKALKKVDFRFDKTVVEY